MPPSYKAFLRVSNGCGWPSEGAQVGELLSTDKIEWLSSYDPGWIEYDGMEQGITQDLVKCRIAPERVKFAYAPEVAISYDV